MKREDDRIFKGVDPVVDPNAGDEGWEMFIYRVWFWPIQPTAGRIYLFRPVTLQVGAMASQQVDEDKKTANSAHL